MSKCTSHKNGENIIHVIHKKKNYIRNMCQKYLHFLFLRVFNLGYRSLKSFISVDNNTIQKKYCIFIHRIKKDIFRFGDIDNLAIYRDPN